MTILYGDARKVLATIEPGSVQAVVTSPPYWGLRSYGDDPGELGTEDLHEYLGNLVAAFALVRHGLTEDGLLWVNIGDTAVGSGGAGGDYLIPDARKRATRKAPIKRRDYRQARALVRSNTGELIELARTQWAGIPGRLAHALQDDGWRLRADITWAKTSRHGRPMVRPEGLRHANRPGVSSERILLLAPGPGRSRFYPSMLTENGDVWHFAPATGRWKGPAPFPDELARRCILASTRPGDLVLDPFSGSGTTVRVAAELGRRGLGIELYEPAAAATVDEDIAVDTFPVPSTSLRCSEPEEPQVSEGDGMDTPVDNDEDAKPLMFHWGWFHAGGHPAQLNIRAGRQVIFDGVPDERPPLAPFVGQRDNSNWTEQDQAAWGEWVKADFAGTTKDRTTAIPRLVVEYLFPGEYDPKVRKAQIAAVAKLTKKQTYSLTQNDAVDAVMTATAKAIEAAS